MSPENKGITLDVSDLTEEITITVSIEHTRLMLLRLALAKPFLSLGCWLGGFAGIEINISEPWLYRCPHCGRDFNGHKALVVASCPHCNYQSLVIGTAEKPYLLNPDRLQDDVELCRWGCHYQEPYGFVPVAGCPVHD